MVHKHIKKLHWCLQVREKTGLKHIFETNFEMRVSKFEMQSQFEWLTPSNIFTAQLSPFQQEEQAPQLTWEGSRKFSKE